MMLMGVQVVTKAKPQQHEFNMPFQLAHPLEFPETDLADDAQLYELPVQPRDVVVAGSDGLFDNMWDEQLCEIVAEFLNMAAATRRYSKGTPPRDNAWPSMMMTTTTMMMMAMVVVVVMGMGIMGMVMGMVTVVVVAFLPALPDD